MGTAFSLQRLLVIDIDGLRQDVFHQALAEKKIPHLSGLLGGAENNFGCHLDPVSTFPSITFCAQSTIFTGTNPRLTASQGTSFLTVLAGVRTAYHVSTRLMLGMLLPMTMQFSLSLAR